MEVYVFEGSSRLSVGLTTELAEKYRFWIEFRELLLPDRPPILFWFFGATIRSVWNYAITPNLT